MRDFPATVGWAFKNSVESLLSGSGTRIGAQLTYYILVSIPALLLIVVWVFSALLDQPEARSEIVATLLDALPLDTVAGVEQLEEMLDQIASGAGALGILAVLGAFYGVAGLTSAVRYAVESAAVERLGITRQEVGHGFVSSKVVDFSTTFIAIILLLIIASLAVSNPLLSVLEEEFPLFGEAAAYVIPLAIGLVMIVMFTLFYRLLSPPNARISFRGALAGAVVAMVGIALLSLALGIYFTVFTGSSAIYGALAGFLAIAFTLNLVSLVIVYGSHFALAVHALINRRT